MRILLAVDGSDHSYNAARALQHLVPAEELIVLHTVHVSVPSYPMMLPEDALALYQAMEHQMREEGERVLSNTMSFLPTHVGKVSDRLEVGSPAEMILSTAEADHVDLIVLGARGLGRVQELVLGSVSHRVVTNAPCSVCLVKAPMHRLQRVLLPLECSEDAEAALQFFAQQPFKEPPEIRVLTVLPIDEPTWPMGLADLEALKKKILEGSTRLLEEVKTKFMELHYPVHTSVIMGSPALAILHEASDLRPDMIVMSTRHRKGVGRLLLGSVCHSVLHRATCPVLILK